MLLPLDYPMLRLFLDGMLMMMTLYVTFSYFQHRNPMYWQSACYIVCMALYFRLHDRQLDQPNIYQPVLLFMENGLLRIAISLYIRLAQFLLNFHKHDPRSYRVVNWMSWALWLALGIDTLLFIADAPEVLRRSVSIASQLFLAGCTFFLVPRILRLRNKVASYFIVGTLLFVVGSLIALSASIFPDLFSRQINDPFSNPLIYMQLGVIIEILCFTLGVSLQGHQIEQEKIRYQAQLIEQLQENERKQAKLNSLRDEIVRDLYDEIGSQLTSISSLSQVTARFVTDERAYQRLTTIGQTARQVMESMQEIVWSLNTSSDSLAHIGLRISEMAHTIFTDSPVRLYIRMSKTDQLAGLTEKQKREICLIAKESLLNVLRHAQAKHVGLRFRTETDRLLLSIYDDGIGFDPNAGSSGLGLASLRQRAERLNADLRIESEFGEGTTVTLICPLTLEKPVTELLLETISS